MGFDEWRKWGDILDDAGFARAFAALGVVAGSHATWRSRNWIDLIEDDPAQATPEHLLIVARYALMEALRAVPAGEGGVCWEFPTVSATVDTERRFSLTRVDPTSWASAWADVADRARRLRVINPPAGESVTPWLRLLAKVEPPVGAVSLALHASRPQLAMEWPLRVAALEDTPAVPVIESLLLRSPSTQLTHAVSIDRDNANCDLLLHIGSANALLEMLRKQPFSCKANLVVLASAHDADLVAPHEAVTALAVQTHASGVVLMPSDDPTVLANTLNAFVEAMSQNITLDRAWTLAISHRSMGDGVIILTDALADLRLQSLAERLANRVHEMWPETKLKLSGLVTDWVKISDSVSADRAIDFEAAPWINAKSLILKPDLIEFDLEGRGAAEVAAVASAIEAAVEPLSADAKSAARYLQQKSFVKIGALLEEATNGFAQDCEAVVRVRIGPKDERWQSQPSEFPEESLPKDQIYWRLTVWLTEQVQLAMPLCQTIILPSHDDASTECEFRFTPQRAGPFEGRLTVLHRGRVLQTAVLKASVAAAGKRLGPSAKPILHDVLPVRHRLGDLKYRRQFDLAFVLNHRAGGEPGGVALSTDRAWIADIEKSIKIAEDINTALTSVAKQVVDYADGLEGDKGRKLFAKLAQLGAWLNIYLVNEQLDRPTNQPDIAKKEYIQIVSTRTDAIVPFEFIYDYAAPVDDAAPCPNWRDALTQGQCPSNCAGGTEKTVCPLGFWGLRKVIERHQVTPEFANEGKDIFLQSEPGRDSLDLPLGGSALFASSSRVSATERNAVVQALGAKLGIPPKTATDWASWPSIVNVTKPRLLVVLAHMDGTGFNTTMEIDNATIRTINITETHLRGDSDQTRPLVALLGCDTAGTAQDYGESVVVFRVRGAAVVIGTIATVFGNHAARVAVLLTNELIPNGAPPQRLGEAIRAMKRRALLDGLLMPLCLVAYGDADWRLVR